MHNIILDVDEVVFPWLESFLNFLKTAYYDYRLCEVGVSEEIVFLKHTDATEWNFYEEFGIDRGLFLFLYRAYLTDNMSYLTRPIDKAVCFTNACKGSALIHYCTARPPFSSKSLITWMRRSGLTFSSLTMIGGSLGTVENGKTVQFKNDSYASIKNYGDKYDLYKALSPVAVVDDKPSYITQALDAKVPNIYLISYKYNKAFGSKNKHTGFYVVNNLGDVKKDLLNKGVL